MLGLALAIIHWLHQPEVTDPLQLSCPLSQQRPLKLAFSTMALMGPLPSIRHAPVSLPTCKNLRQGVLHLHTGCPGPLRCPLDCHRLDYKEEAP